MKDLEKNMFIGLLLIFYLHQTFSTICTENQKNCRILQERSKLCRYAETNCQQWANDVQPYPNEIPSYVLRKSPWNSNCSYEEKFCVLTSQCISKNENCTLNTLYQGTLNTTTPTGEPCLDGYHYCPLLASCIPIENNCSLEELSNFLQQPETYAYFGTSCNDTVYCPGSQTCISNTTDCSYNSSLSLLSLNTTCSGSDTFCVDERQCTNGSCTIQSRPNFNVTDRNTGWKLFCDNFKYICPKTIINAEECKSANFLSQECTPICDRTPVDDCKCPKSNEYRCILKANCINDTIACSEPPTSSCGSSISTTYALPFSSFSEPDSSFVIPMSSVFPTFVSESDFGMTPSSFYPTSSYVPEVCSKNCGTGRFYCSLLDACVVDGYNHCNTKGHYCAKGYSYCNGVCIKANMCPMSSTTFSSFYLQPLSTSIPHPLTPSSSHQFSSSSPHSSSPSSPHPPSSSSPHSSSLSSPHLSSSIYPHFPSSSSPHSSSSSSPHSSSPSSPHLSSPSSPHPPLSSSPHSPSSSSPHSSSSSYPHLPSSSSPHLSSSSSPHLSSPSSPHPSASSSPHSSSQSSPHPSASSSPHSSSPSSPHPSSPSSPHSSSSSSPHSSSQSSPHPSASSSLHSSLPSSPHPSSSSSAHSSSPPFAHPPSSSSPHSSSSSYPHLPSSSSPHLSSSSSPHFSSSSSPHSSSPSFVHSPSSSSPHSSSQSSPHLSSSSYPHLPSSSSPHSSSTFSVNPSSSSSPHSSSPSSPHPPSSSSPHSSSPSSPHPYASPSPRPYSSSLHLSSRSTPVHIKSSSPSHFTSRPHTYHNATLSLSPAPTASLKPHPLITSKKVLPSRHSKIYSPSLVIKPSSTRIIVKPTIRPTIPCKILHFLLQLRKNTLPLNKAVPKLTASNNIAITGMQGSAKDAKWQAFYKGVWNEINQTNIKESSALVLSPTDKLRVDAKAKNSTYHGPVFVNISYVNQSIASGSYEDVTAFEKYCFVILFLPDLPAPRFKIKREAFQIKEDDTNCLGKIQFKDLVESPMPTDKFKQFTVNPNNTYMQAFTDEVKKYIAMPRIIARDYAKGTLYIWRNGQEIAITSSSSQTAISPNDSVCFKPEKNFYGQVKIGLQNCYLTPVSQIPKCHEATTEIKLDVINVDDQFTCKNGIFSFEIMEQYQMPKSDGIMINKITGNTSLIPDIDGGKTGLAIVFAVNSSYGHYEYQLHDDMTWKTLTINSNQRPYGQPSQSQLQLLFLDQQDKLRFVAYDNNTGWTEKEAIKMTTLHAYAWNMADNQISHGMQNIQLANGSNACDRFPKKICCRVIQLQSRRKQARSGCDKKPGSTLAYDACGVCGGKNDTCLGCDGVPNSGAVWDSCNECTGNSTGKVFNYLVDCTGGCNKSEMDYCGVCQPKFGKKINFRDCAGVCFGNATKKCENCVGGNTTNPLNLGMDACGVCNGNNSACKDCNGTIHGKKQIDLCGQCLSPNSSSFNTGCSKLGKVTPSVLPNSISHSLSIPAAGIDHYRTIQCELVKGAQKLQVSSSNFKVANSKKVGVSINLQSSIPDGIYQVVCKFDGSVSKIAENSITIYDLTNIQINSLSPTESRYDQAVIVTIVGSNFFNSPELACVTNNNKEYKAVFINLTAIECHIIALTSSASLRITISFSALDRSLQGRKFLKYDMHAEVARIKNCKFDNSLISIVIEFSKASKATMKTRDCSKYISNPEKLGTGTKCFFKHHTLFRIKLGGKPTLTPNETLYFISTSIKDFYGTVTKYHSNDSCVIEQPDKLETPSFDIRFSSKIGICSKIRLFLAQLTGSGGRSFSITWSVSVDASYTTALSSIQQAALNVLNQQLTTDFANKKRVIVNSNSSLVNVILKFTVTVQNFLGQSTTKHAVMTIKNENIPVLQVGRKNRNSRAAKDLVLEVKTRFDKQCLQGAGTSVFVKWNVDATDVQLKVTDKKKMVISKGTFKAGRTYVLTVSVTMSDNPLSSVSESITVTTSASDLICNLKAPSSIGFTEDFIMDASQCYDPDNTNEVQKYTFEILHNNKPHYAKNKNGVQQRMIFTEGSKVTFKVAEYLVAGKIYVVELTYSKGSRKKSCSKTFRVYNNIPPKVYFRLSIAKYDPTKPVRISAQVCGLGSFKFDWLCQDCQGLDFSVGNGAVMNAISGNRKLKRYGCFRADIGIKADSFLGGAIYSIALTCTSTISVTASVALEMNSPPSKGSLAVSPINGTTEMTFTLTANDFIDDKADSPLSYKFCYGKPGNEECFISQDLATLEDVNFPPGDKKQGYSLTVTVYVSDKHGATTSSSTDIIVMPGSPKSDNDFKNEAKVFSDAISQDPVATCAKITVAIQIEASSSGSSMSESKVAETQTLAISVMNQADSTAVPTKEGKHRIQATIIVLFKVVGNSMNKGTKKKMTESMMILIGITFTSSSKRRRRATNQGIIDPITAAQAEQNLIPFQSLDANLFDSTSQSSKQNFLTYLDALMAGMCGNLPTLNQAPAIARSKIVVIQVYNKDLFGMNSTEISLGNCPDCQNYISGPSFLTLGNTLVDAYFNYICDNTKGTSCSSACIASAQMPEDFLSTSLNSSRISDVLRVKLLNPETAEHGELSATDLKHPMIVKIPIKRKTNGTYQCYVWDSSSGSWVQHGIYTVSQTLTVMGNASYITCAVNKTAYITLLEGPAVETTTTAAPTTPPATTASNVTTAPIDYTGKPSIRGRFSFAVNCLHYLQNASEKAKFISSVKKTCAAKVKVPQSAFQEFDATCGSIVITFKLSGHHSNSTGDSVNASLQVLKGLISSGNLIITLSDGRNLTADTSSFVIIIPVSTSTTNAPTTKLTTSPTIPSLPPKKGLSAGAIVGIVIGVLAALAIIAAIAYIAFFKKKTKFDPSVEPNHNVLEMEPPNGKRNQGDDGKV